MGKKKADRPSDYENYLISLMATEKLTLSEALHKDFVRSDVNTYDTFGMIEHLEKKFTSMLDPEVWNEGVQKHWDKIEYYMNVYVGNETDVELRVYNEEKLEEEKKSSSS